MRLLVTRPEPESARTAAALRQRGHAVIEAPMLRIAPVPDVVLGPGPWVAVALTSINAVAAVTANHWAEALAGLPAFAVGDRTAAAARAAGFVDIRVAEGEIGSLVRRITADLSGADRTPPGDPVLYLAGEDRAGDLDVLLAPVGLAVVTRVVYRAVMAPRLPDAARAALAAGEIDAVLHYSRRSADAFLAACMADALGDAAIRPRHLCLSEQVAGPLRTAGAADIRVADRPDQPALFELL